MECELGGILRLRHGVAKSTNVITRAARAKIANAAAEITCCIPEITRKQKSKYDESGVLPLRHYRKRSEPSNCPVAVLCMSAWGQLSSKELIDSY
jgi:hypothetical protein